MSATTTRASLGGLLLIALAGLAGIGALIASQRPEIERYLKVRAM